MHSQKVRKWKVKNMNKDFEAWSKLKITLDCEHNAPVFNEREVWWCCIGVNIGDESNGKNRLHNRPVLVLRKFNKNLLSNLKCIIS